MSEFLQSIDDPGRRRDCRALATIMRDVTNKRARMWGASIVGYGMYRYRNTRGEAAWPLTGYSPRKKELTVYIMPGFRDYKPELRQLGRYRLGKSCLYLQRLDDVDMLRLRRLIDRSVRDMRQQYECS